MFINPSFLYRTAEDSEGKGKLRQFLLRNLLTLTKNSLIINYVVAVLNSVIPAKRDESLKGKLWIF